MKQFSLFDINDSSYIDYSYDQYPTVLRSWHGNQIDLEKESTHFGFNYSDLVKINIDDREFTCYQNMYFSINGKAKIIPDKNSKGFVVSRLNNQGFFNLGGPIETEGRYKYIDGCSDSLLISPVKFGDPCFNLLHFPANTNQTPHTHPSLRMGMIVKGEGYCLMENEEVKLNEGKIFIIDKDLLHSFKTADKEMLIVVYHPETDFGPTDKNHPMINKTMINGISAGLL
ncbi:cupin domain-containing protein [bacterium]|nr:MAG: cupin domain-containing protein [bacterium]